MNLSIGGVTIDWGQRNLPGPFNLPFQSQVGLLPVDPGLDGLLAGVKSRLRELGIVSQHEANVYDTIPRLVICKMHERPRFQL